MSHRDKNENVHHVFPQSVRPQWRAKPWNQRWVDRDRHAYWHALVRNKTPIRAVLDLLHEFGPRDLKYLRLDPELKTLIALLDAIDKGEEPKE